MTLLKIFISTIIAINCLSVKAMEPLEPWERVNMTEEEFNTIKEFYFRDKEGYELIGGYEDFKKHISR